MRKPTVEHVGSLDGLRAIAALGVVTVHVAGYSSLIAVRGVPLHQLFAGGEYGVDMFFVLSGFLLFLPYARGIEVNTRTYLLRRVARIVPAYWASIGIGLLLWHWLTVAPPIPFPLSTPVGWIAVVSHMTLTQWLVFPDVGRWAGLSVGGMWWSLPVEFSFYLLLPVVALRFIRHPREWVIGAIVLSVGWRMTSLYVHVWGKGLTHLQAGSVRGLSESLLGFADHFVLGMAVALFYVRGPRIAHRYLRWILAAGLVVGLALAWMDGQNLVGVGLGPRINGLHYQFGRPAFALAFAVVLFAIVRLPRLCNPVLGQGPLKWIGDRSYGVYLFHFFVLLLVQNYTPLFHQSAEPWRPVVAWLVVAPLSVVAGALSYRFIERPAMRRIRGWSERKEPVVTSVAQRA